ncbi:unnamed protein product, partial [Ixodes pacificus]
CRILKRYPICHLIWLIEPVARHATGLGQQRIRRTGQASQLHYPSPFRARVQDFTHGLLGFLQKAYYASKTAKISTKTLPAATQVVV